MPISFRLLCHKLKNQMSKSDNAEIRISVRLDEERMPVDMELSGSDFDEPQVVKAMLLSVFDMDRRETLKIDLWTKDMQVIEMDRFMFQTLRGLADTYRNATNNVAMANAMQQFVEYFGKETEILPKD